MFKLHGFATSNYHNVVKLALLEKGIEFEEVTVYPPADPDYLEKSPVGKYPCLETEEGFVSESRVILDYLEKLGEGKPLFPTDPFARAKMEEFTQIVDLYLELAARRVYPEAFFGGKVSDRVKTEAREILQRGVRAVMKVADFSGFAMGSEFSAADIAVIIHVPVVSMASQRIYDNDVLADVPKLQDYIARMNERPTVARVRQAQQADMPKYMAHLASRAAQ